jgi:hypothetical protein
VAQLQPFLGAAQNAATGISNVDTGLGSGLNANQNTLAGLNMNANVGIGNAQASADLADQSLGLGLLGGGLSALTGGLGGGLLGGLGTLGAGLTGGGVGTFGGNFGAAPNFSLLTGSDERLKEHIEPVGELYDGQQIYRYNYIDDLKPRIGLMAQEVAEDNPGAVGDIGFGFLGVDYGAATDRPAELARFLDAAGADDYDRATDWAGEVARFLEGGVRALEISRGLISGLGALIGEASRPARADRRVSGDDAVLYIEDIVASGEPAHARSEFLVRTVVYHASVNRAIARTACDAVAVDVVSNLCPV